MTTRREMLCRCANGFGGLALAAMLAEAADDPLAPHSPHFKAKAKSVIFLFMDGGPSAMDTFDPKPRLRVDHGKPIPMKPLMVSKLNTAAQVALAALVLAALGFGFNSAPYDMILMGLVTLFTLVSVSLYLVEWVQHMSTIEAK